MYALVESGSITKIFSNPKGFVLNNNQYSADIFSKWTKDEKEAIGIYEIETDSTNFKNPDWYINTNESYSFGSGKVTKSWGTATAKEHADKDAVDDDGNKLKDENGNQIIIYGLKTNLIKTLKSQAASELQKTDWYIVRKADAGTAIPSTITTHRAAVRTKCGEMETAITNAADTAALQTLYTYTEQEDGSSTRPLGELPTLEV